MVADAWVSATSSGSHGFGAATSRDVFRVMRLYDLSFHGLLVYRESSSVGCRVGFSHPACQEGQDGLPPVLESSISPGQGPIAGGRPNPWKTVIDRCYGHAAGTRWAQLSAIWASMTLATSR